jgi:hypothetical protein
MAIAGQVQDAESLDAVRAALTRLFERFVIHIDPNAGTGRIEVVRRPEAQNVEGEEMRPALKRVPLESADDENLRVGLPMHRFSMFGPIEVG